MAVEILVPKLGLTMTEGTIKEWLVQPGATVAVGDPIMNMETDKVDVDVEAEAAGIFQPAVPAGSALPPGAVIGWLLAVDEAPPISPGCALSAELTEVSASPAAPAAATAAPRSANGRIFVSPNARRVAREHGVDVSELRGTGRGGRIVSEDVEAIVAQIATATTVPVADGPTTTPAGTPLVRKLAAGLGVGLNEVAGTGPGGKLTRTDVLRAAEALATAPADGPATAVGGLPVAQPLTGLRGAIARNMMASLHEMAQLTLGHEADVTALATARAALKAENTGSGRRTPTISDFVVRAAALALREHPTMNASLRDGQIEPNAGIHVGIAVSLDDGLVVPVLRNADCGSLVELSEQSAALAAAARLGKLGLPQLEGATFAVSSLGTAGIDFFTPIINPGNAGILGVGRMREGVQWEGERPVRIQVLTLSLTFDHRIVDGAPAAAYLMALVKLLARPLTLLAG